MNLRLLEPLSFWTDVDPGPDDPLPDPDRPPTLHLPAGAVLRDAEIEPADRSVGIFNDAVTGTWNGQRIGWFGPGGSHLFVEDDARDPLSFCSRQIAVTTAAAPAAARYLAQQDDREWVVTVELSTRYSTPVVEIVAVHNADDDGADPLGFYAWWTPGHRPGRRSGCWSIDKAPAPTSTTIIYDDDHGDWPASGAYVAAVALGHTPPHPPEG